MDSKGDGQKQFDQREPRWPTRTRECSTSQAGDAGSDEILLHTHQTDKNKKSPKSSCWQGCGQTGHLVQTLVARAQSGAVAGESSGAEPDKLKVCLPTPPALCSEVYLLRTGSPEYRGVHCSPVYNDETQKHLKRPSVERN